jgi:pimeloyl-ACP methyl ester carboxylesterase
MENQIVLNNLLVSYSNVGVGEKTIIFLHGWRSNKEVWGKIVTSDRLKVTSCYAIDLPGFGKSEIPLNAMTVGDYSEVVRELIKKLDLKNVIIIGHSFGGRVGIKLASKYPEMVNKLLLVDAAGFALDDKKKNRLRILAKLVKPFFRPQFMQGLRKKIYQTIGAEDYIATPQLQKTFVNITSEDLTQDMQKISCPTLILTGENDLDTPVEFGKRMNAKIRNSKFEILKNAGHFSFLDQRDEFIKIIHDFI